jgi:Glycosyltransferase like family 2
VAFKAWGQFQVVINYGRDCLVDQCNAGQLAATGEIFIGNQDDMRYPEHWDTEILKLIPDTAALVCLQAKSDGEPRPDLLTLPTIATRALCDTIGPLSPEYDGMFSDNDWSAQAFKLAKVIKSDLHFAHLHPVHGLAEADSVHRQENRAEAYRMGLEVFERRKRAGFPRVELPGFETRPAAAVKQFEEKLKTTDTGRSLLERAADFAKRILDPADTAGMMPRPNRRVAVCLPNEYHQWINGLLQLVKRSEERGFEFNAVLAYTSSPDVTRMALTDTVLQVFSGDKRTPYVLWLDDDNILLPDQFDRMVSFLDNNPRADIVAGWCWIKRGEQWATSVGQFKEDQQISWLSLEQMFADNPAGDPVYFPRFGSGFPCILMRREVLERLGSKAFRCIPREDFEYGKLGEDFSFFWRAHEAGIRCYLDPLCKVGHIKPQLQEPDLIVPPGGELPPVLELWRQQTRGDRVKLPEVGAAV